MLDTRIILSATWVASRLSICMAMSCASTRGEMAKALADMKFNQFMWLGIAVLMLIADPDGVAVVGLPQPVSRWANIIVAVFFFLFNLVGLPTYPPAYSTNSCWRSASASTS